MNRTLPLKSYNLLYISFTFSSASGNEVPDSSQNYELRSSRLSETRSERL